MAKTTALNSSVATLAHYCSDSDCFKICLQKNRFNTSYQLTKLCGESGWDYCQINIIGSKGQRSCIHILKTTIDEKGLKGVKIP